MPYLAVLMMFVFFAGVAMTVGEGLWTNTINFAAVVFAGLAAVLAGFPLGSMMCEKFEKPLDFLWYFTFAGMWLVFFVTILVFRIASERVSKVRVKFVPPLELAAGLLMGLLVSTMFTSFAAFTLLVIPISAGEWDIQQASGWQQSTFQLGAAPFNTVAKACLGAQNVEKYK